MRTTLAVLIAAVAALVGAAAGESAPKGDECVGGPHCYATLQAALAAAADGDTIRVGPGTFAGGVTITKSVTLAGVDAHASAIAGGGPVLTIGAFGAASEPTVSITGLTITGGSTTSSPESEPFVGHENVIAAGGGIEVPPAANFAPGATVTIADSIITGNRAAPTQTVPFGPPCPSGPCPYAGAYGGGIDTWGSLSLANSVVSSNVVAGSASDAEGAGINAHFGDVSLTNTRVSNNAAVAVAPNARFTSGGGLFVGTGVSTLMITDSVIDGNSVSLTSNLPAFAGSDPIQMDAHGGGIHVGDGVTITVDSTAITNNSVSAVDPNGEPVAFDSAMLTNDSPLTMRNTVIAGNRVSETVSTSEDAGPGGSALELDGGGTITDSQITDNASSAFSPSGTASVNGGLAVLNFNDDAKLVTVSHTVISGNSATATSTTGSAEALGGGIFNNSLLRLENVVVRQNVARAEAPNGTAQGGGIWNGVLLSGPPVELTLDNTIVTHNLAAGAAGISTQGGGVYTTQAITQSQSAITGNAPDQCEGC